jgi:hypothetical protein
MPPQLTPLPASSALACVQGGGSICERSAGAVRAARQPLAAGGDISARLASYVGTSTSAKNLDPGFGLTGIELGPMASTSIVLGHDPSVRVPINKNAG